MLLRFERSIDGFFIGKIYPTSALKTLYWRLLRRAGILFGLGLLLNVWNYEWDSITINLSVAVRTFFLKLDTSPHWWIFNCSGHSCIMVVRGALKNNVPD